MVLHRPVECTRLIGSYGLTGDLPKADSRVYRIVRVSARCYTVLCFETDFRWTKMKGLEKLEERGGLAQESVNVTDPLTSQYNFTLDINGSGDVADLAMHCLRAGGPNCPGCSGSRSSPNYKRR